MLRLLPMLQPEDHGVLVWYAMQQQMQGSAQAISSLLDSRGGTRAAGSAGAPATVGSAATVVEVEDAYCSSDTREQERLAATALAVLKMLTHKQPAPTAAGLQAQAEGTVAAVVLADLAQALGASTLEVEPAVMDVLAGHVFSCLAQFTPQPLAVLLWAFARKLPSAAASEVMQQLVAAADQAVQAAGALKELTDVGTAGVLSNKEQRVIPWAAAKLRQADLVQDCKF
jgi:hypothetical protein